MRVVEVRWADEGSGVLKFSLFAKDNKITKSFVFRASDCVRS